MKNNRFAQIFCLFFAFLSFSCSDKEILFEEKKDLKNEFWHIDSLAVFAFTPTENSNYDIELSVRTDDAYRSCNLFVLTTLMAGKDTIFAERKEFFLSDCSTGEPYGKNVGTFYDNYYPVKSTVALQANKKYQLIYKQFMRADTLKNIHSVGYMVSRKN